ncbi:hypothetical protein IMG5_064190 [Ichthyophthirius multifiliis]|uniref:Uncharacterized protein n=1 Tax=Ichthyophthirius multifiliis TaxID=5932 RepID=G0QP53_ICHMU|nr:hypothetical protein IMG5_064190 [Ichthyophthirius multifiliis]EGR33002.1 hypothetical protein IMG5_064190 [Ichthyophthirius multifiliis]|eukprot:XP_004036988.1 hypothetical protein IMG5_064190 [Ichthyophthirius multifiliis]
MLENNNSQQLSKNQSQQDQLKNSQTTIQIKQYQQIYQNNLQQLQIQHQSQPVQLQIQRHTSMINNNNNNNDNNNNNNNNNQQQIIKSAQNIFSPTTLKYMVDKNNIIVETESDKNISTRREQFKQPINYKKVKNMVVKVEDNNQKDFVKKIIIANQYLYLKPEKFQNANQNKIQQYNYNNIKFQNIIANKNVNDTNNYNDFLNIQFQSRCNKQDFPNQYDFNDNNQNNDNQYIIKEDNFQHQISDAVQQNQNQNQQYQ